MILFGLLFIGNLTASFSPKNVFAQSVGNPSEDMSKKMGVMPFIKVRAVGTIKDVLDVPLSELSFNPENISTESDIILTGIMHEEMKKRHAERIVSLLESIITYDRTIIKTDKTETLRTLGRKIGETLGVDMIWVGCIWQYKRRVGSAIAVSSPASVGFGIGMIDVSTGELLWQGRFEETQRPLLDNILDAKAFFKKGAKWLTADELARFGINELFEKYPFK